MKVTFLNIDESHANDIEKDESHYRLSSLFVSFFLGIPQISFFFLSTINRHPNLTFTNGIRPLEGIYYPDSLDYLIPIDWKFKFHQATR